MIAATRRFLASIRVVSSAAAAILLRNIETNCQTYILMYIHMYVYVHGHTALNFASTL